MKTAMTPWITVRDIVLCSLPVSLLFASILSLM